MTHLESPWNLEDLVPSEVKVTQLFLTLSNPMDYIPPGSSVHGIFQARILSGLPFPAPGVLPNPGMEPSTLESPALKGGFFTAEPPGKPVLCIVVAQSVSPV